MSEQYFIEELMSGDRMEGYYLLKSFEERIDKNGDPYYAGYLSDRTGDIPFRIWKNVTITNKAKLESGCFCYAGYEVAPFQDDLYANIHFLRPALPTDKFDLSEIVSLSPEDSRAMFDELVKMAEAMSNDDLKNTVLYLLKKHEKRLLAIPGGKSMHHNTYGGLLYHSIRMARSGRALSAVYPEVNQDLIVAGAIVHDIGKLQEFTTGPAGMILDYSAAGDLLSHNILGILMLKEACEAVGAKEDVFLALSHMIESHHGMPERGSAIQPMFLEADLLHHLDMIDSRVWIFHKEQEKLEPGEVSRPVRALDGPVYRPF